jgi:cytochrome c553
MCLAACVSCHGANGTSPAANFPHLGGQYETYLLRTLKRYKSGERQNAIMQGMVAGLSEDNMENLAAYYASQPGPLTDGTLNP